MSCRTSVSADYSLPVTEIKPFGMRQHAIIDIAMYNLASKQLTLPTAFIALLTVLACRPANAAPTESGGRGNVV